MNDAAPAPLLFRSVKGSRKRGSNVACALVVEPVDPLPIAVVRLSWSSLMAARLKAVARVGAASGEPEGKSLPFTSLRAALQAQIPEAVLLARDLGAPWKRDEQRPFMDVPADETGRRNPATLAASALRAWSAMMLRPWAKRAGVDDELVDGVQELCGPGQAFEAETVRSDLAEALRERGAFDRLRHCILQVIAQRLEGEELFDDLGPVYRIVRGRSSSNEVQFQTWPVESAKGDLYSMVASLAVESGPYLDRPMVTVNASRRRWLEAMPTESKLRGRRSLTGTIMGRKAPHLAVEFVTPVRRGMAVEPFTPEFAVQAFNLGQDMSADLADLIAHRAFGNVFVGIPYSPQFDGKHKVGSGASTRDHLDLFDAVEVRLSDDGFRPIPFRETAVNKRAPKRSEEWHKALELEAVLADIALALGRNDLDGDALQEACGRLMEGVEVTGVLPETALKARGALEATRAANRERVRRAYGSERPTVVVIARTEAERRTMKACIAGLFGDSVSMAERQLPTGVHNARSMLPEAASKAADRFAARVAAWTPLAEAVTTEHSGCHALVQASDWYESGKDDRVNKLAGRYALAVKANANVQYLRPCETRLGWKGLENYLHRIQAALYDLLFGHSALVSEIGSLLKGAFPDEATRPKAVLGISVVTQAGLRNGAPGGKICLATRIDSATGRTTARVGWFDRRMVWSQSWEPFFEALKRIASPNVKGTLGDTRDVERRSFQAFVKEIVGDAATAGDRPLVLVDSTSAATLWPWLRDADIGGAIALGDERVDMASVWPGTRIVRVRTGHAGRIAERKVATFARVDGETGEDTSEATELYCPTVTASTIRLSDGPDGRTAHYWVTSGYLMQTKRGLSVYRAFASFYPAKREQWASASGLSLKGLFTAYAFDISDKPYRLPSVIDVTVAASQPTDDPDLITHMVASLRDGYGHSPHTTTLPAPLSFESKARDYMTRFGLDEADAEDELDDGAGPSDAAAEEGLEDIEPSVDGAEIELEANGGGQGAEVGSPDAAASASESGSVGIPEPARVQFPEAAAGSKAEAPRTGRSPAPVDRWSAFLGEYATGRLASGDVSPTLLGGTALSGGRGAALMGLAPSPDRKGLIAFDRVDGAVPKATDVSNTKWPTATARATGNEEMAKEAGIVDIWPNVAKSPVLPLPSFATKEWLRQKVSITNAVLREIHKWRIEIRVLSGFPWPKERPTHEEFLDILVDGLRYPAFIRAVTRVAVRHMSTAKRSEYNLFLPFQKQAQMAFNYAAKKQGKPPKGNVLHRVRVLVDDDRADIAVSELYLVCLGVGFASKYAAFAKEMPDAFGPLGAFLEVAMVHLSEENFSWSSDVVNQRDSLRTPPADPEDDASAVGGAPPIETSQAAGAVLADPNDATGAEGTRQASEPEAEADPASASGSVATCAEAAEMVEAEACLMSAADASRHAWNEAMREIAEVVRSAENEEPSSDVVAFLADAARRAESAHKAWEAIRPKLVDATSLISAAAQLTAQARAVANGPNAVEPVEMPGGAKEISVASAEQAEAALVEARSQIAAATDARERAMVLAQDFERIEEAAVLKGESKALANAALEKLRELSAFLAEAVAASAEASEPTSAAEPAMAPAELAVAVISQMRDAIPVAATATQPESPSPAPADDEQEDDEDSALEALVEEVEGEREEAGRLDDEASEHLSAEDAEAAADTAAPAEAVTETPDDADDPQAAEVDSRLRDLFEAQEFGLAYHLLRASRRVFPSRDFAFAEPELRLAAMAPYVNHAAMQGSAALGDLMQDVLASVQALRDEPEAVAAEVAMARRIATFGAATSMALFHPVTAAGLVLDALNGIAPGLDDGLYPLRDALEEAVRPRIGLTPALFRAASREAEEDRHGDECLRAAIERIDGIGAMRFNFMLGNKVKGAMCRGDGALGKLKAKLERGGSVALEAARAFKDAYSSRSAVLDLLEEAEARVNSTVKGIDGGARERLVIAILQLAETCNEFIQAKDARPAMQRLGQRAIVQGIRKSILASIEKADAALSEFAEAADGLQAAAARYAVRMLSGLRAAVDGEAQAFGSTDHLMAVHGSLLWLRGLSFGRSWLPSPYESEMVVHAILGSDVPLLRLSTDRAEALEIAVRQRLDEDSFVAARMLVEGAAFFGVGGEDAGRLQEVIETSVPTRRDAIAAQIEEVRRAVDRIQRMGVIKGVDDAQSLLSLLDRIDVDRLPTDPREDARDESEQGNQILDFATAETLLADVRDRVDSLLDKPRREIVERLETLVDEGHVEADQAQMVRGLIDKDDLLTAREHIEFLEDGQGIPASISPNPRFNEYFPAVPEAVGRMQAKEVDSIRTCISEGKDLGPLRFSRITDGRREDVADLFDDWRQLRSRVLSGHMHDHVIPILHRFVERMGITVELRKVDDALTKPNRKTYVAEMRLDIPMDRDSLLLPDFGSQTGGNYQVCIVARLPSEAELTSLRTAAGSMGVVVIVAATVDAERRRQLAVHSIEASRRLLVIDDSLMLYALSEPEFRPLTLFECAQPFSFAAPYRDYGNQSVPPEMFFGRQTEYRKVLEASGSCIVYGGRRLGKTALLQHVKASENSVPNGVAVAYVNIHEIGINVQAREVWEYASRELGAVFPEPVPKQAQFIERVKQWLDADTRRRILVLFDESDRFIQADADDGYREFLGLRSLMDTTNRRFKFVLAGLHNVTRLVHAENPPLKHIASDPQRIGPLMDRQLGDAEQLITRPMAAMGYEFESREDVWRVLSHCNYYPVLVQTFCKGLLENLSKEIVQRKKSVRVVTSEHVRSALEDETIVREIGKTFEYTISDVDPRYALIANIMATRALEDAESGRVREGMTAVEVLDAAVAYWPAAFEQANRLSTMEDLLDEMEGLGVLRRVGGGAWALRSHAILRLLGNEEKVNKRLEEFLDRGKPKAFEPRSMRRPLRLPSGFKVAKDYICPLTLGQEFDLLAADQSGQSAVHVRAVFGNALSDVAVVAPAMTSADHRDADGSTVEIVPRAFASERDLLDFVRSVRNRRTDRVVVVVDHKVEWDGSWVEHAMAEKMVRDGRVRIAFVGGPRHALGWVRDERMQPPPPRVRAMALQPWTDAMVDDRLNHENFPPDQFREALRRLTGGFNRPMNLAFAGNVGPRNQFQDRIEKQQKRLLEQKGLLEEMGLVAPVADIFRRIPMTWIDEGYTTAYEIEDILRDVPGALGLTGYQVIEYGALMGLLEPEKAGHGAVDDTRRHALNPLLTAALSAATAREAA